MRALNHVILTALALILLTGNCFALTESVKTSVSVQNLSGTVDTQNTLAVQNSVSQVQQTLEFKLDGIERNFTVSGSMISSQPDYSGYLVTQHDGTQVPLSSQDGVTQEYSGATHLNWNSGSHTASIGWTGSLSHSPFFQQSADAAYTETFYNKTTALGLKGSMGVLHQPTDYFIDLDFITEQRPTVVHTNTAGVTLDQVVTERYKVQAEADTGIREEDRPRNVGGTFRQSYALTDRIFSRLDLSRISELHLQALKNERGYFTLTSAEAFLSGEPWVDFLVTGSYGYVIENESDPRSGREVQVGSDQFGIGFKYRKRLWTYEARGAYRVSNTGIHDTYFQGGVEWEI